MRAALAGAVVLLGLGGCDAMKPGSEQIKACEDQLLGTLKSPASYKRISADYMVLETAKPPYAEVDITYDAANSFNALLRDRYSCSFRLDHGRVTLDQFDPYAGIADSTAASAIDNALAGMDANIADTASPAKEAASPSEATDIDDYDIIDDAADAARDAAAANEAVRQAVDNAIDANDAAE